MNADIAVRELIAAGVRETRMVGVAISVCELCTIGSAIGVIRSNANARTGIRTSGGGRHCLAAPVWARRDRSRTIGILHRLRVAARDIDGLTIDDDTSRGVSADRACSRNDRMIVVTGLATISLGLGALMSG